MNKNTSNQNAAAIADREFFARNVVICCPNPAAENQDATLEMLQKVLAEKFVRACAKRRIRAERMSVQTNTATAGPSSPLVSFKYQNT